MPGFPRRLSVSTRANRAALFALAGFVLLSPCSPRAAAQPQSPQNATAPRLTHKVEAEYTQQARQAGLEGTVVLSVEIGTDGRAHDFQVVRSLGMGLDEKAIEAARLWEFDPATRDGQLVAVKATIEVNFWPNGRPADRGSQAAAQLAEAPGNRAPRLIRKVEPEYAEEARQAGLEGTVVLGIEVGTDGKAHNVRVIRGLGMELEKNAVEAVQLWEFEPATRDGKPVAANAVVEMNFRAN